MFFLQFAYPALKNLIHRPSLTYNFKFITFIFDFALGLIIMVLNSYYFRGFKI